MKCWWSPLCTFPLLLPVPARCEDTPLPPADPEPVLRLDAGGPSAAVTALAFAPDSKTLYATGYDKVVHVWRRDASDHFRHDSDATYRVPVGAGSEGVMNALAISGTGRWLAVAGLGTARDLAGWRQEGIVLPGVGSLTPAMLQDRGLIYLFDTQARREKQVSLLRQHRGPVLSLAFAPFKEGKPPLLVSLAREQVDGKWVDTLRLWDVSNHKLLASQEHPRQPTPRQPRLSVWHTGPGPRDLQVALAWGDGNGLQVGNPAREQLQALEANGSSDDTVVFLPHAKQLAEGTLFTGSYHQEQAQLQGWKVSPSQPPVPDPRLQVALHTLAAPRALALIPGPRVRLAAVVRYKNPDKTPDSCHLHLLDLGPRGFEVAAPSIPLWQEVERRPMLAASPDGKFVAIAGNPEHEVLLFRVADLVNEQHRPWQRLDAVGTRVNQVAFVRRGDKWGLRLQEKQGTFVFDVAGRKLTSDQKEWKEFAPDSSGWTVTDQPPDEHRRWGFEVAHEGKTAGQLRLPADRLPTAFTLLPGKHSPINEAILAVAHSRHGVTSLGLYHLPSGQQVRRYTGHVDRIRALAFSQDGRLLASAGDDQTVRIWSLTDLAEVMGKRGRPGPLPRWAQEPRHVGAIRHVWLSQQAIPPDAQLLHALDNTLMRIGVFGLVKEEVEQWAHELQEEHPRSVFTWAPRGILDGLRLGGQPK